MAKHLDAWTPEEVAARFEEAADVGRRLPQDKARGYFNAWPAIQRQAWEAFATDEKPGYRRPPPGPDAIERMLETMRWVQWLEVEQRHLVWLRAKRVGWKDIATQQACCSRTAQRHWQRALGIVAERLNEATQHPGSTAQPVRVFTNF